MRSKVLFPALKAISLGGKTLEDGFDARVDEVFFQSLFEQVEKSDDDAQIDWERMLAGLARAELDAAVERCPLADAQRFRCIAAAQAFFRNGLAKHFPDVVTPQQSPQPEGAQP